MVDSAPVSYVNGTVLLNKVLSGELGSSELKLFNPEALPSIPSIPEISEILDTVAPAASLGAETVQDVASPTFLGSIGDTLYDGLAWVGNGLLALLSGSANFIATSIAGLLRGGADITRWTSENTGAIGNGVTEGLKAIANAAEEYPVITALATTATIAATVSGSVVCFNQYRARQAKLNASASASTPPELDTSANPTPLATTHSPGRPN